MNAINNEMKSFEKKARDPDSEVDIPASSSLLMQGNVVSKAYEGFHVVFSGQIESVQVAIPDNHIDLYNHRSVLVPRNR